MAKELENERGDSHEYEIGFLAREGKDGAEVIRALSLFGGRVNFEGPLKKFALSYKIKKENQAEFGYIRFVMDPEKIKDLEKDLRNNPAILRFLVVRPVSSRGKVEVFSREEGPRREASSRPVAIPSGSLPLSNEALEKKIEEILQ